MISTSKVASVPSGDQLRSARGNSEARELALDAKAATAPRIIAGTKAPGALVMGGALGAVAIARSLGRHGIPVRFLNHDHPIAGFSRYVGRTVTWPGPEAPDALASLLRIVREQQMEGWVLFVCGDSELRFASQNYNRLAPVLRLACPTWEIARWAYDKHLTYQRAAEIGVNIPWSYRPHDANDVMRLDCRFPLILKPTVREQQNAFTLAKAWRVDDRAALIARYQEAAALVGESNIILQELIPGGGEHQFSFAAICDSGVPVASLVARRTRQYPVDFGYTSTFVETIDAPEIESAGRRIVQAMQLTGLVEVEFKRDERDGCVKLLDVNARPWTWIGLGSIAGVDFPWMAWQLACGLSVQPASGRPGAVWIHASRDFVAAARGIWAKQYSPISYLRCFQRPLTFAAFAKDDPMPAFLELPLVAWRVLSRRVPNWFSRPRRAQVGSGEARRYT
jgi:D-aspartate ligase